MYRFVQWDGRHSEPLCVIQPCLKCRVIDLLVEWRMVAALCIDVVRQKVVAVVDSTDCRVGVTLPVCVEGRLSKVSGEGRISQPSGGVVEL